MALNVRAIGFLAVTFRCVVAWYYVVMLFEQYPWEVQPSPQHSHHLPIQSFYINKSPVTNSQYDSFLQSTQYSSRVMTNFLRHWRNGTVPPHYGNKPVVWVDVLDAQAYCLWLGGRLPNEVTLRDCVNVTILLPVCSGSGNTQPSPTPASRIRGAIGLVQSARRP
jgi:hypothetical protein